MADLVEIASDALSAAIDPHGAELTHLRDAAGRALMTDADPAFWTGHAPILFPVVGAVNAGVIRLDGTAYPMPRHGIARRSDFAVIEQTPAGATFALTDTAQTRLAYPFAFALEIAFTIEQATLTVTARIANRGNTAMPASFGFHPAFAWPLPYGQSRAAHRIVFDAGERDALPKLTPEGLIAAATRPSPVDGRTLALHDDLFTDDALIWDQIRSQRVRYGAPGGPQLDIAFPGTPMLGIWSRPGARYICIEPWHGIADPEGFTGDFRAKPGVFEIAPGAEQRCTMTIALAA